MDAERRKEILETQKPDILWPGEPLLGGYYTQEEIDVVVDTIKGSMSPDKGFGFICEEIEEFEAAFADYCGAKHCVSINGAGSGLDMEIM